jgi:hypothetical protein
MAVDKFSSAAGPQHGMICVTPTSIGVDNGSASSDAFGKVTFSGTSGFRLNGVFNSLYENYKIIVTVDTTSAGFDQYVRIRMANTGSSPEASSVYRVASYQSYSDSNAVGSSSGQATLTSLDILATGGNAAHRNVPCSLEVFGPAKAGYTHLHYLSYIGVNPEYYGRFNIGKHSIASAYDGFYLFTQNSTAMGGTVRVYGYNN